MNKKEVKRYELIVEDKKTAKKTIIPIKASDGKFYEKGTLMRIDYGLTQFENKESLIKYLIKKQYIDNKDSYYFDVYIRYYHSKTEEGRNEPVKREIRLDIIYSDQQLLKYFCSKGVSYIDVNDPEFKKIFIDFMAFLDKGSNFRHAKENNYVNSQLLKLFMEYIENGRSDLYLNKIKMDFSRYKAIRGYIIGKNKRSSSKLPVSYYLDAMIYDNRDEEPNEEAINVADKPEKLLTKERYW